jgi:DNA-binding NarL/FixJ family response regulator
MVAACGVRMNVNRGIGEQSAARSEGLEVLLAMSDRTARARLMASLPLHATISVAVDGRELFWSFLHARRPVDLVICEVDLAIYCALDVLEAWHALHSMPRVILLARNATLAQVERALRVGVTLIPFSCLDYVLAGVTRLTNDLAAVVDP